MRKNLKLNRQKKKKHSKYTLEHAKHISKGFEFPTFNTKMLADIKVLEVKMLLKIPPYCYTLQQWKLFKIFRAQIENSEICTYVLSKFACSMNTLCAWSKYVSLYFCKFWISLPRMFVRCESLTIYTKILVMHFNSKLISNTG